MDKLQELAILVFITPLYVIATVAIGALYVMAAVKAFQFIKKKLGKSEDETALDITSVGRIYTSTSRSGDILETSHTIAVNCCTQTENTKQKCLCISTAFMAF